MAEVAERRAPGLAPLQDRRKDGAACAFGAASAVRRDGGSPPARAPATAARPGRTAGRPAASRRRHQQAADEGAERRAQRQADPDQAVGGPQPVLRQVLGQQLASCTGKAALSPRPSSEAQRDQHGEPAGQAGSGRGQRPEGQAERQGAVGVDPARPASRRGSGRACRSRRRPRAAGRSGLALSCSSSFISGAAVARLPRST